MKLSEIKFNVELDDENIPEVVNKCISSWKRHNPGYIVNILNKKNTKHLHGLKHGTSPNRYSDYVRLDYLSKYGGIWIDASIFLNESLDWVQNDSEFTGYYIDKFTITPTSPVVESWFLSCPSNSRFIQNWRDEFFRMEEFETVDEYLEDVKRLGVDFSKIEGPNYLAIHVSAQKIIQKNEPYNLTLFKAEDDAFKYLEDNAWNSDNAVKEFCNGKYRNQKIIKMRGLERNLVKTCEELGITYDS
jgi:hypothetical protein